MRGALAELEARLFHCGIIPAYAGSTWGIDRSRFVRPGSSPRMRGARATAQGSAEPSGIIPAYAGSTERPYAVILPCGDHPRVCGEHRLTVVTLISKWIIPAYAGSTRCNRVL